MRVNRPIRLLIVACLSGPVLGVTADEGGKNEIVDLVADYFKTADRRERAALAEQIRKASEDSIVAVAAALGKVQLWETMHESNEEFDVRHSSGRRTRIAVTLPADYDAKRRYPLILALCDSKEIPAESSHQSWPRSFTNFVVAAPQNVDGYSFHTGAHTVSEGRGRTSQGRPHSSPGSVPHARSASGTPGAGDPIEWLAALRRRYHLDTDRIYLYGSGVRGDAAFIVLVMHSDLFAAAVIREATLDVPYRRELQRLLLANLHDTPLHLMWTEPDLPPHTAIHGRQVKVTLANRSIVEIAREANLPISQAVTSANGRGDGGAVAPSLAATRRGARSLDTAACWRIFERTRPGTAKEVHKWFRYPAQGHAGFLHQRAFAPPVWEGDQIDFHVRSGVDRSAFITRFFESRLARLAGRIEKQRIEITATHSKSVEIRLGPGLVDFAQPVTIFYNGKRRFTDQLRPSIVTLLESAYAYWEFQRPTYVRLRVGDTGRVLQY